jgi:sugar phosphate isomerase/epimerase
MDLIAGGRVLSGQIKRLRGVLDTSKLAYTAHGPIAINFMQSAEITPRHSAIAVATLEAAAEIGARKVVIHTGHMPASSAAATEDGYARQREALARLGEKAAEFGIVVAVENIFVTNHHDHTALPSRLAREIAAIAHPNIRACLDFSHAAITCAANQADYMQEVAELAKVATHLHLHDSFGDPVHIRTHSRSERVAYGLGDLHLPIGWGNLPWETMMQTLTFEAGVTFNLELPQSVYGFALADSVAQVKAFASVYASKTKLERPA